MKRVNGGELPTPNGDHLVRKQNAKKLAAGYTKKKRFIECCYLSVATFLWFTQFVVVARYFVHSGEANLTQVVWSPLMVIAAMTVADFIGGVVHWGLDTWGTPETPVFGNFIRSFREHHVDQTAMTKHDFIETNADTTLPLIPVLLVQRYFIYYGGGSFASSSAGEGNSSYGYNVHQENVGTHVFLLTLTLCIALTNEIHKWSHEVKPNPLARVLMAYNIILTPSVHRRHHRDDHDISYCITTGWLNVFLDRVEFWRKAERVVTALTGAIPRANDQQLLGVWPATSESPTNSPVMSLHSSPYGVCEIRVEVTHGKRKMVLLFPAENSTVGDLKNELMRQSGVPIEKQRLLFGAPVLKTRRREGREEVRLINLISDNNDNNNSKSNNADVSAVVGGPALSPSTITIPLMLVGSVVSIPHINEEAVAQLRRLVTTTVEQDSQWFRCSYSKGYVRQTAFVCRTCVRSGRADAAHAICYACAEVCHRNHDVEEWGVRYYMRCDCCTAACWRPIAEEEKNSTGHHNHNNNNNNNNDTNNDGEPQRCCFIIDSVTGLPPATSVVPHNSKNRYPRNLHTWCYCDCEENHPPDEAEAGGIVCMLCATCYWSTHMTRLCTEAFRRIPCYGDVVEGDVVAFHCRTCETLVCCPCRLRCHKDHDVCEDAVLASRASDTHNDAPVGVEFSCGCRGCCDIAVGVSAEDVHNPARYSSMSSGVATAMMNSDAFVGFLCGRCMMDHPWLVTHDPRHCYAGQLPTAAAASPAPPSTAGPPTPQDGNEGSVQQYRSVVPCGLPPDAPCPADVYPFHGMLFPVDAFTETATCTCGPCREAYTRFAPRASIAAGPEMMVQLHDACDHCGHTIRDEQAFMCQTCELQHDQTFFVCQRCNTLRLRAQMPELGTTISNSAPPSTTTPASNNDNHATNNTTNAEDEDVVPWDHPISHVFVEDTFENLYTLCGMQMIQDMDSASREYVMDNIDVSTVSFEGIFRRTFGQEPLEFDLEEVVQHQQQLSLENERVKRIEDGDVESRNRKHPRDDDGGKNEKNSSSGGGAGGTEGGSEKRKKDE